MIEKPKVLVMKNILLAILGGAMMFVALYISKPAWDRLLVAVAVITIFAAVTWVFRNLLEQIVIAVIVSFIVGLGTATPGTTSVIAWGIFSVATSYILTHILASGPYKLNYANLFALGEAICLGVIAVLIVEMIAAVLQIQAAMWLQTIIGVYSAALSFRRARKLKRHHPHTQYMKVP